MGTQTGRHQPSLPQSSRRRPRWSPQLTSPLAAQRRSHYGSPACQAPAFEMVSDSQGSFLPSAVRTPECPEATKPGKQLPRQFRPAATWATCHHRAAAGLDSLPQDRKKAPQSWMTNAEPNTRATIEIGRRSERQNRKCGLN